MGRSGFASRFSVVSAVVIALFAGVAYGDVIVDQACDDLSLRTTSRGAYFKSAEDFRNVGQTFTPDANNIVGVDLYLFRSATFNVVRDVTIAIYAAPGHTPNGSPLTSVTIQSDQISTAGYDWYHLDLPEAPLTAGGIYAIVISVEGSSHNGAISLGMTNKDNAPYAPGRNIERKDGPDWTTTWSDAMFRTYAVPEPSTMCLLTAGVIGTMLRRRR